MSRRDERVYLLYILDATEKLIAYANTKGAEERFMKEWVVQEGIFRKLQTMAETTQRLAEKTKSAIPGIDWPKISGFRHIMVHGYLGEIHPETVWRILMDDVPALDKHVRKYYKENYDH